MLSFSARARLHRLSPIAWLALATLAFANVALGVRDATLYSQDFQWSPAVLLMQGHDPYAWFLSGNPDGRILMSQEPNYLPGLYLLLAPFAMVSFGVAKAAWALTNVALGLFCAHVVARRNGLEGSAYAAAVLIFLCSTPVSNTIGNGQTGLLALAAMLVAWRAKSSLAQGGALALGSVKYSFAPSLALWMLLRGRFGSLAAAAAVSLAAAGVFAALSGASFWAVLIGPLAVSMKATGVGLADAISLSRAFGLDANVSTAAPYAIGLAACVATTCLIWSRRLDGELAFALLCQSTLFCLFHQLYDYVFLLPLLCRAARFGATARAAAFLFVAWFWFGCRLWDLAGLSHSPLFVATLFVGSVAAFALFLSEGVEASKVAQPGEVAPSTAGSPALVLAAKPGGYSREASITTTMRSAAPASTDASQKGLSRRQRGVEPRRTQHQL